MLFVPPSIPFMVPEAESYHGTQYGGHHLIGPSDWVSDCEITSNWHCTDVVFPENGIVVIEVHNVNNVSGSPADLYKAEIFIDKGDCQNNYYNPDNCSSADPNETFSRWNLPARGGGVSCVSGMTMWGNEYASMSDGGDGTEGLNGPSNSVCDGTITVTRSGIEVYQYKIDTSNLADGEHKIQGSSVTSSTGSGSWNATILVGSAPDTTPPLIINSLDVWANMYNIWRFNVMGDAPPSTNVTVETIRPDGVVSHESSFMNDPYLPYNHYGYLYGLENLPTTQPTPVHYGIWTLKVCAPEYDMCVEENFTVFSDPTPVLYSEGGLPTGIWLANNSTGYNVSFMIWASDQQTINGDYTYEPAICSPSSNSLFPIGNTTVTCTATDDSGNVGTLIFDVLVALDGSADTTSVPTVTASAYHNDTSPTGRTLYLNADGLCGDRNNWCGHGSWDYTQQISRLYASISMPDGSLFSYTDWSNYWSPILKIEFHDWVPQYHFPIPVDWVAGSYDIIWENRFGGAHDPAFDVVSTVTVPALPAVGYIPTVTASAYLNDTSSTGRTLHLTADENWPDGWDNMAVTFSVSIAKGNTAVFECQGECVWGEDPDNQQQWHQDWYMEIPVDWTGEYTISWVGESGPDQMRDVPGSTTVTIPALPEESETEPQPEIVIPNWIKNNAGWWADGLIDDGSFVAGLQWLITHEIMHIPPTEQGTSSDNIIPGWIKNNAGWWATNQIDDRAFVTGLQWLITNGIMIIG